MLSSSSSYLLKLTSESAYKSLERTLLSDFPELLELFFDCYFGATWSVMYLDCLLFASFSFIHLANLYISSPIVNAIIAT